jgi:hypothetical protein
VIKKTLILAILTGLPSLCLGMMGTRKYVSRAAYPYLRRSYATRRMPKNLPDTEQSRITQAVNEEKVAWQQLSETSDRLHHQRSRLKNAVNRLQQVSLYERLFGKPSYFDNRRRKIANQDIEDAAKRIPLLKKLDQESTNKWGDLRRQLEKILEKNNH